MSDSCSLHVDTAKSAHDGRYIWRWKEYHHTPQFFVNFILKKNQIFLNIFTEPQRNITAAPPSLQQPLEGGRRSSHQLSSSLRQARRNIHFRVFFLLLSGKSLRCAHRFKCQDAPVFLLFLRPTTHSKKTKFFCLDLKINETEKEKWIHLIIIASVFHTHTKKNPIFWWVCVNCIGTRWHGHRKSPRSQFYPAFIIYRPLTRWIIIKKTATGKRL